MPRRVDHIDPTHDDSEMAAYMACEETGLFTRDGVSYSDCTGRIRKFVIAFMKARQKLAGTNKIDMQQGRLANLANKWYYYGMQRTVRRKHASQGK